MAVVAQATDATRFADAMRALLPAPPPCIAVAVSGGADSMALCLLANQWAKAHHVQLHALTVDHGLRAESAAEAQQVHSWLTALGIDHHILTWQGDKPSANVQASAREARYSLMSEWCSAQHVAHLLLAHHLDDQAETFLIRLGRGSGVDGLAAMNPISNRHGLSLLRPLLGTTKAQLIELLQSYGQTWAEDPSNTDSKYTRSRVRALLPQLEEAGISELTLAATAERMTRARDYLEQQTALAAADCLMVHEAGYLLLDYALFGKLHEEIALRVLVRALSMMNGTVYRPRFSELKALFDALDSPRTLAGCKFEPAGDKLHILRELSAIAPPAPLSQGRIQWDSRYRITCAGHCEGASIGALGKAGRDYLRENLQDAAALRTLPASALMTLPTIWHLEKPVLVPHIGYKDEMFNAFTLDAIRIDRLGHLGYV